MYPNITALNIATTICIKPDKFIGAILVLHNLRLLHMQACEQFNESQIMTILLNHQKLERVNVLGTDNIRFCNILLVACELSKLKQIEFDMLYGIIDIENWDRLDKQFAKVDFGCNVNDLLRLYRTGNLF